MIDEQPLRECRNTSNLRFPPRRIVADAFGTADGPAFIGARSAATNPTCAQLREGNGMI
jgi:hypothetical protein